MNNYDIFIAMLIIVFFSVVRTNHLKGRRGRLPSKAKGPKDTIARPSPTPSLITNLVQAHICTNPASANIDTSKVSGF